MTSSVRFLEVELPTALSDFFKAAGVNYLIFGEAAHARTRVTLDVSNEKVIDALMKIAQAAGMRDSQVMQTLDDPPAYFLDASRVSH